MSLSIRIDDQLAKAVIDQAKLENKTVSALVTENLKEALEDKYDLTLPSRHMNLFT